MKFHAIRIIKVLAITCVFIVFLYPIHKVSNELNGEIVPSPVKIAIDSIISTPVEISIDSTISSIPDFHQISYKLKPYTTYLPHFPDDEARDWFLKSTYYKLYLNRCPNSSCEKNGFLFDDTDEHLQVHLALVKNGLYLNDDCGYKYGDEAVRRTFKSTSEATIIYDKAIIYTVPDGWSFQHFLDGIGPKLSHSRIYLDKYPDAKVIIREGPRMDSAVKQIWSLLGADESSRVIHHRRATKLGAGLLINPCRTPATHPDLWHNARRIYWSLANLSESSSLLPRKKFIYIQRTKSNSKNQGRLILNEEPFIQILRQYAAKSSLEFILYDHSKQDGNIVNQIRLFYQARVVIGVHGGAQSNMNFVQPGTTVIEIMPYHSDQSTVPIVCSLSHPDEIKPCVGYIYYTQSQLLNLSYWILPTPVDSAKNLNVNLNRVKRLFDSLT